MSDKIKAARQQLGDMFRQRRQQMGRTQKEVADFLELSAETVKGIETGRFAWDIDLLFRLCAALEIKPFFAPQEEITLPATSERIFEPKFLFAPDHKSNELYILHRHFPACLIQVVQTAPATFRIIDLYDNIEEKELATHHFLEEAKAFWREYGSSPIDDN